MKNSEDLPHGAQKCGAKNRKGLPCTALAMRNGRCRFHGGLSTGPKTDIGKAKSRRGNWKHGNYSAEINAESTQIRELLALFKKK